MIFRKSLFELTTVVSSVVGCYFNKEQSAGNEDRVTRNKER